LENNLNANQAKNNFKIKQKLNKINYIKNPEKHSKEEKQDQECLGRWLKYKTEFNENFNLNKPYFVVLMQNQVVIDFDVITPQKILDDEESKYSFLSKETIRRILENDIPEPWDIVKNILKDFCFPIEKDKCYIVKTGTGGFHYYCNVSNPSLFSFRNTAAGRHELNISIDSRASGGIVYGSGTKWKDRKEPYIDFLGNEETIPNIDGWKIAAITGKLDHEVLGVNIFDFLSGKTKIHETTFSKGDKEFIIWLEATYLLKQLGYNQDEVIEIFATVEGFDRKKCEYQVKYHWNNEDHPNRIKAKKIRKGKQDVDVERALELCDKIDVDSFKDEDIERIIELIDLNSISDKTHVFNRLKTNIRLTKTQFNAILGKIKEKRGIDNRNKEILTPTPDEIDKEWEVRIRGEQTRNSIVEYVMDPVSISIEKFTILNGEVLQVPVRTEIWRLKDFKIDKVLVEQSKNGCSYKYTYRFKGNNYRDNSFKQMRDIVAQSSLLQSNYKQIFGPLIDEYVEKQSIPKMPYSKIMGFTVDGWRLPNIFHISTNSDIHAEIRDNVETMLELEIEEEKAKEYMLSIYNAVNMKYKDIIFAHGMIMPFLYALRSYTDLIYWVSISSLTGGTGKSMACKLITKKIWNNCDNLNKNIFESSSRGGDYLSSSTFGIAIDDCQDLGNFILSLTKTYQTQETKIQKKTTEQKFSIDKYVTTPLLLNFNSSPEMMQDDAFLQRGFNIPADIEFEMEDKDRFDVVKLVPDGYIGKYIYLKTQDWDLSTLVDLYKKIVENDKKDVKIKDKKIRVNSIYRCVKLGSLLFKIFFKKELDISAMELLLKDSKLLGSEDIFSMIQIQIFNGTKRPDYNGNMVFRPEEKWIQSEIEIRIKKEKLKGYFYNVSNLQDLNRRLNIKKQSLATLFNKLKTRWDNIKEVTNVNGKSIRAIFIPASNILKRPERWDIIEKKLDDSQIETTPVKIIKKTENKKETKNVERKEGSLLEKTINTILHFNGGLLKCKKLQEKIEKSIGMITITDFYNSLENLKKIGMIEIDNEEYYKATIKLKKIERDN